MSMPTEPTSAPTPAPRRRRRLSVSFRTVVILVFIIGGAALGWQINRAREIKHAVGVIDAVRGYVHFKNPYDDRDPARFRIHVGGWLAQKLSREYFMNVEKVSIHGMGSDERCRPDVLHAIAKLPHVSHLLWNGLPLADPEFEVIEKLTDLEALEISEPIELLSPGKAADSAEHRVSSVPRLSKGALERLGNLRKLQSIELAIRDPIDATVSNALSTLPKLKQLLVYLPRLTDSQLQSLGAIRNLRELTILGDRSTPQETRRSLPVPYWPEMRSLCIAWTTLSTEDMQAISRLPKLEKLQLHYAKISEPDLELLCDAKQLKKLVLRPGQFPDPTIDTLKTALPKLEIEFR